MHTALRSLLSLLSVIDITAATDRIHYILFCAAEDCGPLAVPLNGSYSGRETTFPNEVIFSCDAGFILNGAVVRRCLSNGSWSGAETYCKGEIVFLICSMLYCFCQAQNLTV